MLRGEPKGQASPVPTGRPSSPLSSLSEDQDPGRGRAARPTPGAHSPSLALRRSWSARAARACSAALRPARRARRAGWTPGTAAHRSVLYAGFLGRSHNRTRARPRRSQPGRQVSRTSGLVTAIRALGSPATPANLSGGRCGSLLWRNRSPHGRSIHPAQSHARCAHGLSGRFGRRRAGTRSPAAQILNPGALTALGAICLRPQAVCRGSDWFFSQRSVVCDGALPNPPAAFWQQRAVLTCATGLFYLCYPWGAFFCTLSALGFRSARPPSPGQPTRPLLRDDPDHVRQIAAAFATPLLDRQEPKPGCFPDSVLNHPATHPSPGRKLVYAPIALPVLADLIADDPQHRQLADRELAGQRRRHRTRGGEVPTTRNRDRALGGALQPPGWEERGSARWDAHRLDLAAQDAPAGMQALG